MDEIRGFGFSLANEEMRNLGEGATTLHKNFAGIKEFEYGKNKEGYWNNDTFIKHLQEFLPIFESLHPNTQVLLERGLYTPGMTKDQAKAALSKCGDFKNEMSVLETFLVDRGHLLLVSPKCHPELAGCGIEYMLGKIKWTFS
jgi:hypothetical protein